MGLDVFDTSFSLHSFAIYGAYLLFKTDFYEFDKNGDSFLDAKELDVFYKKVYLKGFEQVDIDP